MAARSKVLALALLMGAAPVLAQDAAPAKPRKKFWYTYPQPRKDTPYDPMKVYPGYEIPMHPERYVFKTSADGQVVPLFDKDGVRAGEMPVDTEVKLDMVMPMRGVNYYAVPQEGGKILWVSGRHLKPASYTPPAPD